MSGDTFDLSKDFDWMCERGSHFPIAQPTGLNPPKSGRGLGGRPRRGLGRRRRGCLLSFFFFLEEEEEEEESCFQVSAVFHKPSDQHVSVAVTQTEAEGRSQARLQTQ